MDKQQFISAIGGMQESLRRFLLVLTHGNEELANDLAQEAILKAYLHCATFEQNSALQTWVFRIAFCNTAGGRESGAEYADSGNRSGFDEAGDGCC